MADAVLGIMQTIRKENASYTVIHLFIFTNQMKKWNVSMYVLSVHSVCMITSHLSIAQLIVQLDGMLITRHGHVFKYVLQLHHIMQILTLKFV